MAAVSMEDINREAEARVRRHGAFGVSERQIARALAGNEMGGNIDAVDMTKRLEDEAFYENMPMNDPSTDPTNAKSDRSNTEAILDQLRRNAAEANARPRPQPGAVPAACSVAGPGPAGPAVVVAFGFFDRCRCAASGLMHDLLHWDAVPGSTTLGKCRRIMHGRFEYIAGFLVVILVVATLIKCFAA